jgi:hypothetical protein
MQSNYAESVASFEEALPEVLMRVVSELHDVAYLIERIEPFLSNSHGADLAATDRLMVLQGIDLAVQKTRGLAEFIDTMTAMIPEAVLVDVTTAVNLVKLADMQKALAGGMQRHGHSQPLTRAAGDCDLFKASRLSSAMARISAPGHCFSRRKCGKTFAQVSLPSVVSG